MTARKTTSFFAIVVLALFFHSAALAQQVAAPDADLSMASWSSTAATRYTEVRVLGVNTTYISSTANTTGTMSLSGILDPQNGGNCTIRVTSSTDGTNSGGGESVTIDILEGGSSVAVSPVSFQPVRVLTVPTDQTAPITLSPTGAGWSNLTVQVASSQKSGETVRVHYVALECPNPPAAGPTLAYLSTAGVTSSGATLGATITTDNGTAVGDYGFVWGTSASPTGNSSITGTSPGSIPPPFNFSEPRSPMTSATKIYFRGWANNGTVGYAPDHTFWTEPQDQPNTLSFSSVTNSSMNLSWNPATDTTNTGTLVVVKAGTPFTTAPGDGTVYSAGTSAWNDGTDISGGSSEFVVWYNPVDAVSITGMSQNTTYKFNIYEYAGSGTPTATDEGINYRQSSPLTGCRTTEPTAQASTLTVPTFDSTTMDASWIRGTGDGVIVVMRQGNTTFTAAPSDGATYSAGTSSWNDGTDISGGSGEYVVYIGTGTTVNVTGLTPSTQYSFIAYEYAVADFACDTINYKQGSPPTVSGTTDASATQPSLDSLALDASLADVTATAAPLTANLAGCGGAFSCTEIGFVWNTTGAPTTGDTKGWTDTPPPAINPGVFTATIGALPSGTKTYTRAYAINSNAETGYSNEISSYTEPGAQPVSLVFSAVGNNTMTISWSDPGGATAAEGAIVVMKAASAVTQVPIDGTEHPANANFGTGGTDLGGSGTDYAVFRGSGNSVIVNNLLTDTTYYVAIYQYAGSGTGDSGINYLEGTPLTGSRTTTGGAVAAPALTAPVIKWSTATRTSATNTQATIGATIDSNGGGAITAHGTDWSTTTPVPDGANRLDIGPGTTGAFTHVRTGLNAADPNKRIYFKAFATNGAGTGYSPEGSFYREPPTQAAPPVLSNVDYFSMTIAYTVPAGADGVLVVVKQTNFSASQTPPYDGVEYTPDLKFGAGDTTAPGCMLFCGYVVARETTNGSVDVTNLRSDMNTHVAVYAYNGSGTGPGGINYVQTVTATASATTLSTAGFSHNEQHVPLFDDPWGAGCTSNCHGQHHTSQLLPRGTDQYAKCATCHDGTTATDNIGLHLNETDFPGQVLDCGTCHTMHSFETRELYSTHRTDGAGFNAKFIRSNMSKYVNPTDYNPPGNKTALDNTVYQTAASAGGPSNDAAYDSAPFNGICQTCHDNLGKHTQDGQNDLTNTPSDQAHELNNDCTLCHSHKGTTQYDGFKPSGGSCNGCHGSVKNAGTDTERRAVFASEFNHWGHHTTDGTGAQNADSAQRDADCEVCHLEPASNHMDGFVDLKNPDTGVSIGAVQNYDSTGSAPSPAQLITLQNNFCLKCHDTNGATSTHNNTATAPFSAMARSRVSDTNNQLKTSNRTYHPVIGPTGNNPTFGNCNYLTNGATTPVPPNETLITCLPGMGNSKMVAPWNTNVGTQTMTCFDCHQINGHGTSNQRILNVAINYDAIDCTTSPNPVQSGITTFCTQCHAPTVYLTPSAVGTSAFEHHGASQAQHRDNYLGCYNCHGAPIDCGAGINPGGNGAQAGGIHGSGRGDGSGSEFTWDAGSFARAVPPRALVYGGMMSVAGDVWDAKNGAWVRGECGGGNCNHTGKLTSGGQSWTWSTAD